MNGKTVIINDKERAVSDDINKAQAYLNEQRMAALRGMFSHLVDDFWQAGEYDLVSAAGTYLPAEVFGGLMVQCDSPGYVTVTPGVLGAYAPGLAGADDSPYCVVSDPGVTDITVLTFVPNAGAGPRIDVIECRVVADTTATSLRDIGDPVTRLYTPTVVPKYAAMKLEYRKRNGVAGGACPAADPDWLPLAVAVVLVGALGYNACDFYDVRPLVSERVGHLRRQVGVLAGGFNAATIEDRHVGVVYDPTDGVKVVAGYAWGECLGYLAGGNLWRNAAVSVAAKFGVSAHVDEGEVRFLSDLADNQALPWAPAAEALLRVVAVFPGLGVAASPLPRWKRYAQSGAIRRPEGPNGILLLSDDPPTYGNVVLGVALPAAMTGLGTAYGVCLAIVRGTNPAGGVELAAGDGRMVLTTYYHQVDTNLVAGPPTLIQFPITFGNLIASVGMRKLRCRFKFVITAGAGPAMCVVRLRNSGAPPTITYCVAHDHIQLVDFAQSASYQFTCDVPLLPRFGLTDNTVPTALVAELQMTVGAGIALAAVSSHLMTVIGWE
jgi:hypothetical protein